MPQGIQKGYHGTSRSASDFQSRPPMGEDKRAVLVALPGAPEGCSGTEVVLTLPGAGLPRR